MKRKYLALGLSLALMLGLVACGHQAEQEPQEPAQEIQQTEPVTMEPTAPPVETEPQEEPKQEEVTEPVEVKENDPEGEAAEPATVATVPEATSVPTETPSQKPMETKSPEATPVQNTSAVQQDDGAEQPTEESQTTSKDGWDQAFYETLTPEQKAVYESLPNASSRNMMKQDILKTRELEAQGWITEGGTPTDEQLRDAWGNIQMGQ